MIELLEWMFIWSLFIGVIAGSYKRSQTNGDDEEQIDDCGAFTVGYLVGRGHNDNSPSTD